MAKEKIQETIKNPEAQGSGTEKKDNTDCYSQCCRWGFFHCHQKQCKRTGGKIQEQPERYSRPKAGFTSCASGLRPS